MIAKLAHRIFARYIEEGWLACEQVFIHETRAQEYDRLGKSEEAAWQRREAQGIRHSYGQAPEQWISHG